MRICDQDRVVSVVAIILPAHNLAHGMLRVLRDLLLIDADPALVGRAQVQLLFVILDLFSNLLLDLKVLLILLDQACLGGSLQAYS